MYTTEKLSALRRLIREFLRARRAALENCARNTGAKKLDGGCQALEHTGAVRVIAYNFGEGDLQLIRMAMAHIWLQEMADRLCGG
jgi:hypothetical protein